MPTLPTTSLHFSSVSSGRQPPRPASSRRREVLLYRKYRERIADLNTIRGELRQAIASRTEARAALNKAEKTALFLKSNAVGVESVEAKTGISISGVARSKGQCRRKLESIFDETRQLQAKEREELTAVSLFLGFDLSRFRPLD